MEPPLKPFHADQEGEIQEIFTPEYSITPVVGSQFALPYAIELTVAKKASGGGAGVGDFSITDPNDNLLFMACRRNLAIGIKRVLLNAAGVPILCANRKLLSLYNRWDAYRGDQPKPADALFSVRRSAYFQLKTSLNVFLASAKKDRKPDFKIKGNYVERKCTVLHGSQVIAEHPFFSEVTAAKHRFNAQRVFHRRSSEDRKPSTRQNRRNLNGSWRFFLCYFQVKRKLSESNMLLGRDTFAIAIYPGTDYAFIVTLVVIMDEIHREQEQTMVAPAGAAGRTVVPDTGRNDGWN